jgi:hypothetical protein
MLKMQALLPLITDVLNYISAGVKGPWKVIPAKVVLIL